MLSSLRTNKDSKMTEAKRKVGRKQSLRSQTGSEEGRVESCRDWKTGFWWGGGGGLGGGGGGWKISEI